MVILIIYLCPLKNIKLNFKEGDSGVYRLPGAEPMWVWLRAPSPKKGFQLEKQRHKLVNNFQV